MDYARSYYPMSNLGELHESVRNEREWLKWKATTGRQYGVDPEPCNICGLPFWEQIEVRLGLSIHCLCEEE